MSAVIDGGGGIGFVVATRAMGVAIEKARASGLAVVVVRNSNHLGAVGLYALAAAEAGFLGLATSNASPIMAAAGSRHKAVSNAPFAYAVPTGLFPLVLDVAMSATAGMKVRLAAERGEEIPLGWVLDADGRATTDPGAYAAGGSLAPLGGHKGYGLALLTEVLAGALSGAAMTRAVVPWLVEPGTPTNAGHAFVVMDVECFMGRAEFEARMRLLVDEMHELETAPGVDRVVVPGEPEHHAERRAAAEGLVLERVVWGHLERVAETLDLGDLLASLPLSHTVT
ncbi:MAG: Ldh family oxidoreductase [Streptosporangiales bacterium]|nr:Ldh family oxidoreductase [Streptosporangiales bacterium]